MLNTFTTHKSSGFSLIELMIGIAIFAITMTMGISSYRVWIQNTQVRNAAQSVLNGLQRARSEAIKNNLNVTFLLGSGTKSDWAVNYTDANGVPVVVESRSSNEGSKNVDRTVMPTGALGITYSSLGTAVPNPANLTQVYLHSTTTSVTDSRNLVININAIGNTQMVTCNPNLPTSSTGACP
jgi:type IV fimbrial biogenesis protein FimT